MWFPESNGVVAQRQLLSWQNRFIAGKDALGNHGCANLTSQRRTSRPDNPVRAAASQTGCASLHGTAHVTALRGEPLTIEKLPLYFQLNLATCFASLAVALASLCASPAPSSAFSLPQVRQWPRVTV